MHRVFLADNHRIAVQVGAVKRVVFHLHHHLLAGELVAVVIPDHGIQIHPEQSVQLREVNGVGPSLDVGAVDSGVAVTLYEPEFGGVRSGLRRLCRKAVGRCHKGILGREQRICCRQLF